MSDEFKTYISVKLKTNKTTKELFQVFVFLLVLFILFFFVGSMQVYFCKQKSPEKTIKQCLRISLKER